MCSGSFRLVPACLCMDTSIGPQKILFVSFVIIKTVLFLGLCFVLLCFGFVLCFALIVLFCFDLKCHFQCMAQLSLSGQLHVDCMLSKDLSSLLTGIY